MRIFGILGILLVLGTAVAYIDRSAVARVEGARVMTALKNRQANEETLRAVADKAATAAAGRAKSLQLTLDALPPPAPPLGEFCRPGCSPQWSAE